MLIPGVQSYSTYLVHRPFSNLPVPFRIYINRLLTGLNYKWDNIVSIQGMVCANDRRRTKIKTSIDYVCWREILRAHMRFVLWQVRRKVYAVHCEALHRMRYGK